MLNGATLADQAQEAIRADILARRLQPGRIIRMSELTELYGVSPTPLREALQRLATEGLVELDARRGARIPPLSIGEVRDIYRARRLVETEMLQDSIVRGDEAWLDETRKMYRKLLDAGEPPHPAAPMDVHLSLTSEDVEFLNWFEIHREFHWSLFQACDSVWLKRLVETLYRHSERYLVASVYNPTVQRRTQVEHGELFRSVEARDVQEATRSLERHLNTTLALVEGLLAAQEATAGQEEVAT